MPLVIDSSRAFRSPLEVTGLVEAIVGASPNDESDWVEWKNSALMLGQKAACFAIARHTLGMANGAEPGQCQGVTEVDPADLDAGIRPYLGSDGPRWSAQYVKPQLHGGSVLVVTVERRGAATHSSRFARSIQNRNIGQVRYSCVGRVERTWPGRATFRILQTGTRRLTTRSHCMSGRPGLTIHYLFLWTPTIPSSLKHGKKKQGLGCYRHTHQLRRRAISASRTVPARSLKKKIINILWKWIGIRKNAEPVTYGLLPH